MDVSWGVADPDDDYHRQILHGTQRAVIDQMMQQASHDTNSAEVRAILNDRLEQLAAQIEADGAPSPHERLAAADIRRWQSGIPNTVPGPGPQMPAGDPIGGSSRGGGPLSNR